MEVGDIGIIDHPLSDAGVIVKIERVTATRACVCYYSRDGEWTKPQTRKVRRWHKIAADADLSLKRAELLEAFKEFMADKQAANERHEKRIAEIAS